MKRRLAAVLSALALAAVLPSAAKAACPQYTFAGLSGTVPASYLDANFICLANGYLPLTGGTVAGPVTFQISPVIGSSPLAASATTDTTNASNISSGTLAAARGGAGTVNGVLKANGSGAVSAAIAGTDFAPATSGSSLLAGNGSGGFSNVTVGTGLNFAGGTLSATGGGATTPTIAINSQSGPTYTVQGSDQAALLMFTNNASNVTVSLPQAGTGAFTAGWYAYVQFSPPFQVNNPLSLAITPTTSTIGGLTSYVLYQGGTVLIVSDGTNYQVIPLIALTSKGSGYSLTPGVSNLGAYAVDLQINHSNANTTATGPNSFTAGQFNTASSGSAVAIGNTNVASGPNSVALGISNTASAVDAVAIGFSNVASGANSTAIGNANRPSAQSAVALGDTNFVGGNFSAVLGNCGSDNSNVYTFAYAGGSNITCTAFQNSRAQWEEHTLRTSTTGAASVRLTADGAAAGAHNVVNLGASSAGLFYVEFVGVDTTTGASLVTYTLGSSGSPALVNRGSSGSVTLASGNPTFTAGPNIGAPTLGAAPALAADTTNQGLSITVTPPAGNTDTWVFVAKVHVLLTRYN